MFSDIAWLQQSTRCIPGMSECLGCKTDTYQERLKSPTQNKIKQTYPVSDKPTTLSYRSERKSQDCLDIHNA